MTSTKLLALATSACIASTAEAQIVIFSQNWTDISQVTANDNWSSLWNSSTGVGIVGFRGDGLTGVTGTDPQTILAADSPGVLDVNANQTNPNTFLTGGVTEFHLANPTIAIRGSGTATAPYLIVGVSTLGLTGITISYDLRDIDGSINNAVQQVALHYRLGNSGPWTNLGGGYVADASSGPSLATLVTPVSVTSPAFDNASLIQFRIMTSNAVGVDEAIGVDNIQVTSVPESSAYFAMLASTALGIALYRRRVCR